MGIRCWFGCTKFKYHSETKRECLRCGRVEVFVEFYGPGRKTWLDKPFVDHWGTYENLRRVSENIPAECCGRREKDCNCLIC